MAAAVVRLHMDLAHHWEAGGCAPLVVWGEELEGVRAVVAGAEAKGRAGRAERARRVSGGAHQPHVRAPLTRR